MVCGVLCGVRCLLVVVRVAFWYCGFVVACCSCVVIRCALLVVRCLLYIVYHVCLLCVVSCFFLIRVSCFVFVSC